MMNNENGFVTLEWPYGIRLKVAKTAGKTGTEHITNAKFACTVVDVRTGSAVPGFAHEYPTPDAARDAFIRMAPNLFDVNTTPEIDRMLTLSTSHVSAETSEKLTKNGETDELPLSAYPKATFGWFVYFSGLTDAQIESLPEDLRACIRFAQANDCTVLCFDEDATPHETLKQYE